MRGDSDRLKGIRSLKGIRVWACTGQDGFWVRVRVCYDECNSLSLSLTLLRMCLGRCFGSDSGSCSGSGVQEYELGYVRRNVRK